MSLSATSQVIRIPRPSAKRNPLKPIGRVQTQGTPETAAGTGSIIAGTSLDIGAVALLYSFTNATLAPVFVA